MKPLTDVLSPVQQSRFRELTLQWLETVRGPGSGSMTTAAGYPGVAEAIKLTAG